MWHTKLCSEYFLFYSLILLNFTPPPVSHPLERRQSFLQKPRGDLTIHFDSEVFFPQTLTKHVTPSLFLSVLERLSTKTSGIHTRCIKISERVQLAVSYNLHILIYQKIRDLLTKVSSATRFFSNKAEESSKFFLSHTTGNKLDDTI